MSLTTKKIFKDRVAAQQAAAAHELSLLPPVFKDNGFITTAILPAPGGKVELRCGPAGYEVDVFVHLGMNRWTLNELLTLPGVREWLKQNRADFEGKTRVEAEIDYVFRFIKGALAQVSEMSWLRRNSEEPPATGP